MRGALLGPQRSRNCISEVFQSFLHRKTGRAAVITAGWQERESQDGEIRAQIGWNCVNLHLYRRTELLFSTDEELGSAHRARQDQLRLMQEFYRFRLERTFEAALDIERKTEGSVMHDEERQISMEQIRRLDADHLARCKESWRAFEVEVQLAERPSVGRHREEIQAILSDCDVVVIAGGHVAALLNRLRLFGMGTLLQPLPLIAWSAGAMATGGQVVLFHETPPEGVGVSEILDQGLGLHQGIVPLPDPRMRLKLEDPLRVGWLARRYEPLRCVALDHGEWIRFDDDSWSIGHGSVELLPDGRILRSWAQS